ncbi:MAG TPA: CpsD/CapB family tyrosine-protein kinase [Gammaproteobacteria bacterium]|jgi:capsular exopolysaccharide synthesis family protein|nr:CpsD/CapB family tyrosine-protein kinase [Gammaproteobacteria bacterium]
MLHGEGNTKPLGRGVPPVIRVEARDKDKDKTKTPETRADIKEGVRSIETGRPKLSEINARQIDKHLVSLTEPDSYEAEQYRKLRYVLEEKRKSNRGTIVAVCSPAAGDGKSLTALNLGAALAQARDSKVLLVDVDLRRESAALKEHLRLGNPSLNGVTDAITSSTLTFHDVARPLSGTNLSIVFTGSRVSAPYELLRSARFEQLLIEASKYYQYVILDAPPVVPVSDCRVIRRFVDYFLMIVSAHRTPKPMLEEALDLIGPDKLLGMVFNRGDLMPRRYYGYYRYGMPMRETQPRREPSLQPQGNSGNV